VGDVSSRGRTLVVHLPVFRLERCGFGAHDLAALIAEWKSATRIVAATPAAREQGVSNGMTATEARALLPDLELLPWDESGESTDRAALCFRFEAFSDRVEPLGEPAWDEALAIDITHTAYGDERGVAERAVALARSLGHVARAAVADDPLAARAIAEWVAPEDGFVVALPGESAGLLAPLPITALVSDDALCQALLAVGIEEIGSWARLAPAAVAHRYGALAVRLHGVARGLARPLGMPRSARPVELPVVKVALAGATTHQEIAFVLPGVLEKVSSLLANAELAAVRLRVVLRMESVRGRTTHGSSASFTVRAGRPTRSARALCALVVSRLERFRIGLGDSSPIEELQLEVLEAAPEIGWQPGLTERAEGGEPLPDVIARLADQLGDDAVFVPRLRSAWRPEEAWASAVPSFADRRLRVPPPGDDPVDRLEHFELPVAYALPRPTLLLPRPEPVEIECGEEGANSVIPLRVRVEQGWKRITARSGPERLSGSWWTESPYDREYWAIAADGRWLWVCREQAVSGARAPGQRWWLYGYFD
jgi:protein ImuB